MLGVLIALAYGGTYSNLPYSFQGLQERSSLFFIVAAILPLLTLGSLPVSAHNDKVDTCNTCPAALFTPAIVFLMPSRLFQNSWTTQDWSWVHTSVMCPNTNFLMAKWTIACAQVACRLTTAHLATCEHSEMLLGNVGNSSGSPLVGKPTAQNKLLLFFAGLYPRAQGV